MKALMKLVRAIWPDTSNVEEGQLWLRKVSTWKHGPDTFDLVKISCISREGTVVTNCPPNRVREWLPPVYAPGPALSLREIVRQFRMVSPEEAKGLGFYL